MIFALCARYIDIMKYIYEVLLYNYLMPNKGDCLLQVFLRIFSKRQGGRNKGPSTPIFVGRLLLRLYPYPRQVCRPEGFLVFFNLSQKNWESIKERVIMNIIGTIIHPLKRLQTYYY